MTKTELATKALQRLRVLSAGETPDSDDLSLAETAYDALYAALHTEHLVTWDSAGDIPDRAVLPMSTLLASEIADDFEIPEVRLQRLVAQAQAARSVLATVKAPDYVPEPIPANYY